MELSEWDFQMGLILGMIAGLITALLSALIAVSNLKQ